MRWLGAFSLVRLTETIRTFLARRLEGEDIAQILAVANVREGTDGSHVASPWLSEPATIAVSMAIKRPQAIDDAPVRAVAQRRMTAQQLSCLREEWAKPRGRKSRCRHCGKAIEAQPSCGQIAPSMRPRRSCARRPAGKLMRRWGHARAGVAERARAWKGSSLPEPSCLAEKCSLRRCSVRRYRLVYITAAWEQRVHRKLDGRYSGHHPTDTRPMIPGENLKRACSRC
jgi:hypothetical protein